VQFPKVQMIEKILVYMYPSRAENAIGISQQQIMWFYSTKLSPGRVGILAYVIRTLDLHYSTSGQYDFENRVIFLFIKVGWSYIIGFSQLLHRYLVWNIFANHVLGPRH